MKNSEQKKMRLGAVLQIRINPDDIMTCIDLAIASGMVSETNIKPSLATIVSQSLKGMCAFIRENNINGVHEREGFEYIDMVAPFINSAQKVKLRHTENLYQAEINKAAFDIQKPVIGIGSHLNANTHASGNPERQRLIRRYGTRIDELNAKQDIDPANFSPTEQRELDELIKKLNGE